MSGLVKQEEAERAVLGACCLSEDAVAEVSTILSADKFYSVQNGMLWDAINSLHEKGKPVDAVTLCDELTRRKTLGEAGGPAYVAEVLEAVPYATHASFYARLVHESWQRREIVYAATQAAQDAKSEGRPAEEIAATLEGTIHKVLESNVGRHGQTVDQIMHNLWQVLDKPQDRGVPTGYADLDRKVGGLRPQTLTILAARPSIGKSALAGGIALNVAHLDVGVLFFALEQSAVELAERWLCVESRVGSNEIRKGELDEATRHLVLSASSTLSRLPIMVDDSPGRTLSQIANLSRLHVRKSKVGLIVIDYLQLMEPEDRRAPREQQVSALSRGLKCLAKSLNVPIVCLAQLNRQLESRTNKRPMLSDLRESGSIEQDADTVLLLHRPSFYAQSDDPDGKAPRAFGVDDPTYAEVVVAKNRAGETGTVKMTWIGEQTAFRDWQGSEAGSKAADAFDDYGVPMGGFQ